MDADQASFPEYFFDYILCGFVLHLLEYSRTLVSFRKMLKPGGCFDALESYVLTKDMENMERW